MKAAGTITGAGITCDLVSHESSHDFRVDIGQLYMEGRSGEEDLSLISFFVSYKVYRAAVGGHYEHEI